MLRNFWNLEFLFWDLIVNFNNNWNLDFQKLEFKIRTFSPTNIRILL